MRSGVNLAAINKLSDYTFMEYFVACACAGIVRTRLLCKLSVFFSPLKVHVYLIFEIPTCLRGRLCVGHASDSIIFKFNCYRKILDG